MKIWCELCKGKGGGTHEVETMNYVCNFCAGEGYLEVDDQPTLRDQFAMAALTGFLSSQATEGMGADTWMVEESLLFADAMMKARER